MGQAWQSGQGSDRKGPQGSGTTRQSRSVWDRIGTARTGVPWKGMAGTERLGVVRIGALRIGWERRVKAGYGEAGTEWQGLVGWDGRVRARCGRQDTARRVQARLGADR
jgi:hypothetical protein